MLLKQSRTVIKFLVHILGLKVRYFHEVLEDFALGQGNLLQVCIMSIKNHEWILQLNFKWWQNCTSSLTTIFLSLLEKESKAPQTKKTTKEHVSSGHTEGIPFTFTTGEGTGLFSSQSHPPISKEMPQAKSPSDILIQLNQPEAAICIWSLLSSRLSSSLLTGQSAASLLSQFSHLENGDRPASSQGVPSEKVQKTPRPLTLLPLEQPCPLLFLWLVLCRIPFHESQLLLQCSWHCSWSRASPSPPACPRFVRNSGCPAWPQSTAALQQPKKYLQWEGEGSLGMKIF